ncbi:MAG: DUF2284 domain-containing protein [Bacteroidales bacterium]|uniref:DUF2284 domain-containing protein n=1 Tax=Porphyromonas sp. TaxID=1924944 RepID=UPI002975E7A7|nr:DUF2284 domain-containing protein [Porphyromonas sp.]MDD7437313.1 DUF2284 domain-containing protein [Bacteroidales bacterium]MDY3067769.1 DUF2284 domain-containing protein [Porphyromonas sp.]
MKYGEIITHTRLMPLHEYVERYQHIERYREACKNCRQYGKLWSCPPYEFDINALLEGYSQIELFGYEVKLNETYAGREGCMQELMDLAEEIGDAVRLITDRKLMTLEKSRLGSRACFAGSCRRCARGACTRLEDKPCRHPEDIRYSLENFCFDLMGTSEEVFGIPTQWIRDGKLPTYYFYLGALLF